MSAGLEMLPFFFFKLFEELQRLVDWGKLRIPEGKKKLSGEITYLVQPQREY